MGGIRERQNHLTLGMISFNVAHSSTRLASMFDIETYDYDLPPRLIAQYPAPERDRSRLLVVDRTGGGVRDQHFVDLPGLLQAGDLLVVNDTKVVPARLMAKKETGGRIELLVLDAFREGEKARRQCWCLYRASKRPKKGSRLLLDSSVWAEVLEVAKGGFVKVVFNGVGSVEALLKERGEIPLPPYIHRGKTGKSGDRDRHRYQTVFSRREGAIAAPTAGLHFTERLLKELQDSSIDVCGITLHVGYGTFQPVRTRDIRKHRLAEEYFSLSAKTVKAIRQCRERGGRVVAVGTTVVRALETVAARAGELEPCEGMTDLLIYPGFQFKVVDALITNFHLPMSSLLFLVSAFAGLDLIKKAYAHAVKEEYRFYSYGDAMLIL